MANFTLNKYEQIIEGTDPVYLLSKNLRESIIYSFTSRNFKMEGSYTNSLGCGFKTFKKYIEEQMEDWMTWNNFCYSCDTTMINISWTIKYKTNYDIKNDKDLLKQNHYTNIMVQCHSEVNLYN
tara:strand:+ start:2503 stop:2874 length:372 start_codon:yes stop_codon:yes gene_type:complete